MPYECDSSGQHIASQYHIMARLDEEDGVVSQQPFSQAVVSHAQAFRRNGKFFNDPVHGHIRLVSPCLLQHIASGSAQQRLHAGCGTTFSAKHGMPCRAAMRAVWRSGHCPSIAR